MTTGKKVFNFKRTLKYDSKWLDSEYLPFPKVSGAAFFADLSLLVIQQGCYLKTKRTFSFPFPGQGFIEGTRWHANAADNSGGGPTLWGYSLGKGGFSCWEIIY